MNNLTYIKTMNPATIPWHSLTGPYERADDFPGWLAALASPDAEAAEKAPRSIAMNFEHQSSLWHVTPFAMICLYQGIETALPGAATDPAAAEAIGRTVELYRILYDAFLEGVECPDPLPRFTDLLAPEHLPRETRVDGDGADDEDAVLEDYYDEIDEHLFFSFFYYSWLTLALSMREQFPRLRRIAHASLAASLDGFSNVARNQYLASLLEQEERV